MISPIRLRFVLFIVVPMAVAKCDEVDFVKDVQPIFREHCLSCHGKTTQESEYRLDVRALALRGGEFGEAAIVPGKSAESPLIRYVAAVDESMLMPPATSAKARLAPEQVGILRAWIDQGAVWPETASAKLVDRRDWWSLKPLKRPDVPVVPLSDLTEGGKDSEGATIDAGAAIDSFIRRRLAEQGLVPSPQADRRTLIRRIYFDLLGLPPTPEDVDQFVADTDPNAWEHLVDKLLDSPRYGERWARHWLDVVHYGETHGYDKDRQRPNAWPYRDYVIRAFNEDKTYARFVQEQIAGDVLFPGTRDGIEALGLIAAGPWDLISHQEVPETKVDGKIARHIDRDDMVQNTIVTFNSLTIGCAQCHDHKFDAITQEDYYCLQAVFAAVDRADKEYFTDDSIALRAMELKQVRDDALSQINALEKPLKQNLGKQLDEIDSEIKNTAKSTGNARAEFGYHSRLADLQNVTKWVQVDLGRIVNIERVALLPCFDDFNHIGAGFGFPVRFKIETCNDPEFASDVAVFWSRHHETFMSDFPNPGLREFSTKGGMGGIDGRYVRVTATKLASRKNDFNFALAELQVFDSEGTNVALGQHVSAFDSIESPPRWQKTNLTDGVAPTAPSQSDRQELVARRNELILSVADKATRAKLVGLRQRLRVTDAAIEELPEPSVVYVGTVHTGNGNFQGTGRNGGKPRPIHLLRRGDVNQPGDEVSPGALTAIPWLQARFDLPTNHTEGDRRAALARWLTDPQHPLTWRSIANRVWQFHFGRGLVDTPNDFGRNGATPTHPELLDWLACELRDGGGSLKELHKLIVTSETYRQVSTTSSSVADNIFLSRMNRRKLDAESIRDSVLLISGKLDTTMGGPSFQEFVVDFPENSPHYEYGRHDPDDPSSHRRSIYRFIVRSQLDPFMTALDCADPSMQVDKRNESLSPIQALTLLNNGLMVTMSKHFAAKLDNAGGDMGNKIKRAFREALSREPTSNEQALFTRYAEQFGLANTCRVIFNLNEFAFVD